LNWNQNHGKEKRRRKNHDNNEKIEKNKSMPQKPKHNEEGLNMRKDLGGQTLRSLGRGSYWP
jgi:hypothetical protein